MGILCLWAMGSNVGVGVAFCGGVWFAFGFDLACEKWVGFNRPTKIGDNVFPVCALCGSTLGTEFNEKSGYLDVSPCDCCVENEAEWHKNEAEWEKGIR